MPVDQMTKKMWTYIETTEEPEHLVGNLKLGKIFYKPYADLGVIPVVCYGLIKQVGLSWPSTLRCSRLC